MLLSIVGLGILPFCKELIKSDKFVFGKETNLFFYVFITVFICLGIVGAMPAEYPYTNAGIFLSKIYFLSILALFVWSKIKNKITLLLCWRSY
jgi:hypothetical protein